MSLPVELDRDEARELAARELAHPRYDSDPPLLQQAFEWVVARLRELLSAAGDALSGTGGIVLLVLIAGVVTAILVRYGMVARRRSSDTASIFDAGRRSAREYRAAADAAAEAGRWSEAVVERFRAIVADLDERAVIELRPGMTADEATGAASRALPGLADDLSPAAALFDAVYYGGREATPDDDGLLRAVEAAVRECPRPHFAPEPA